MMAQEPIPYTLADPADEVDHGLHPVDSTVCQRCGGIGGHGPDCAITARIIWEGGRIVVTSGGDEIALDPVTAAQVAIAMLRRILEVSPETLNEPAGSGRHDA